MAKPSVNEAPEAAPAVAPPEPAAELDPRALAEGILARTIRPRAADVRRLAEAFLAAGRKPDKKKKSKKAEGKKRKLGKIPGQKAARKAPK